MWQAFVCYIIWLSAFKWLLQQSGNSVVSKTHIKKNSSTTRTSLPIIGWREWVALPELGIEKIKVKVDSGAQTSSLHAVKIRNFTRNGEPWVQFVVHPVQRKSVGSIAIEAPVLEYRSVRSSNGRAEKRPVIVTLITLYGVTWPIELTLASRTRMSFRMLLGREAFRGRFLVDAGRSYLDTRLLPDKRRTSASKEEETKTT